MCIRKNTTRIRFYDFGIVPVFLLINVILLLLASLLLYEAISKSVQMSVMSEENKHCISAGIVLIAATILGYFGFLFRSSVVFASYLIFVGLLIIFQPCLAIYQLVKYYNPDESFIQLYQRKFRLRFETYGENNDSKWHLDWMQNSLECCGMKEPQDWMDRYNEFPKSCYSSIGNVLRRDGCFKIFNVFLKSSYIILAGINAGTFVIEVAGLTIAFLIAYEYDIRVVLPGE